MMILKKVLLITVLSVFWGVAPAAGRWGGFMRFVPPILFFGGIVMAMVGIARRTGALRGEVKIHLDSVVQGLAIVFSIIAVAVILIYGLTK